MRPGADDGAAERRCRSRLRLPRVSRRALRQRRQGGVRVALERARDRTAPRRVAPRTLSVVSGGVGSSRSRVQASAKLQPERQVERPAGPADRGADRGQELIVGDEVAARRRRTCAPPSSGRASASTMTSTRSSRKHGPQAPLPGADHRDDGQLPHQRGQRDEHAAATRGRRRGSAGGSSRRARSPRKMRVGDPLGAAVEAGRAAGRRAAC